MANLVIDTEIVSEVKVGGDWYSIKHGSLQIGEMSWRCDGQDLEAGTFGFSFEIYGSQAMVMAGPVAAITGVRFNTPL